MPGFQKGRWPAKFTFSCLLFLINGLLAFYRVKSWLSKSSAKDVKKEADKKI